MPAVDPIWRILPRRGFTGRSKAGTERGAAEVGQSVSDRAVLGEAVVELVIGLARYPRKVRIGA